MNPVKTYTSLLNLLILAWFGNPLSIEGRQVVLHPLRAVAEENCQPQLLLAHYALPYVDRAVAERMPAPQVTGLCTDHYSLSCAVEFVELAGCGANFSGYFQPSRWMVSTNKGDGGVDVTGAPNVLLVEGANEATVNVSPGGTTGMYILIPASGLMTFDCRQVGGSNLFSSDQLSVQRNEEAQAGTEGHYSFPVRQGDRLTLSFSPDQPSTFRIADFHLQTSAASVLQRVWTVRDSAGDSSSGVQFISIEQPNITDVVTPDDRVVLGENIEMALSPEVSGYPYLNAKGKSATLTDLVSLRDAGSPFQVSYTDDIQEIPEGLLILRRWRIADPCGNNVLENPQVIKVILAPVPGMVPGDSVIDLSAPRRLDGILLNTVSRRSNEAPDGQNAYSMTY